MNLGLPRRRGDANDRSEADHAPFLPRPRPPDLLFVPSLTVVECPVVVGLPGTGSTGSNCSPELVVAIL
jgi:hypothetical protein